MNRTHCELCVFIYYTNIFELKWFCQWQRACGNGKEKAIEMKAHFILSWLHLIHRERKRKRDRLTDWLTDWYAHKERNKEIKTNAYYALGTQWLGICDNIYAKWNVQIARKISQHTPTFRMNSLKIRYQLNYDTEMALGVWVGNKYTHFYLKQMNELCHAKHMYNNIIIKMGSSSTTNVRMIKVKRLNR